MSHSLCMSKLSEPESHPCFSLAGIITGSVTNETFMGWTRRRVRHRQNPPEPLQELRDALVHEWNNIQQDFIQRFIGSMRRRCEAIVAARGGHTHHLVLQTSILHDNLCLSMICYDNDVEKCFWYCLICYAHVNLNYTIFFDFLFSM
jgi:epoxyqueuosine reductase QueG